VPAQVESDPVLAFFVAVLQENNQTLGIINTSATEVEFVDGELVFSLIGLQDCIDSLSIMTRREFRQLLYGSTINQQLSAYGAELVVYDAQGKVDKSRYRLKRLHKD